MKGDYTVKDFEVTHMIVDDDYYGEESVTTDFTLKNKDYSVTFNKSDLEIINSWVFEEETSLPANLSDDMIEALREYVKEKI
jgi:hypothetical protein